MDRRCRRARDRAGTGQRGLMKRHWPLAIAMAALLALQDAQAQQRALPPDALRSGIEFAGSDVRAMQADDAANPGFLWVERGEKLWHDASRSKSCDACHGDAGASMRGVSTRNPAYDQASAGVLDLEGRINACRVRQQKQTPLERESDD